MDTFGGRLVDYWSFYEGDCDSSDGEVVGDDYGRRGVAVQPKYDSLKQEVTQNDIATLSERQFDDLYLWSLRLRHTVFCRKNLRALHDVALNERFKMAPNSGITVNHIISMAMYCRHFAICSQWIEALRRQSLDGGDGDDYGECSHWFRFLSELSQLFGRELGHSEFLYVIPEREVLFKAWSQMIYVPVSVHPPLDRSQSFLRELRHYHSERTLVALDGGSRHILKLGRAELDGLTTRYFDVRWLSGSVDDDERFLMMAPVKIEDILLDEDRSSREDIFAMQLFERIVSGQMFRCEAALSTMQCQKRLQVLVQSHCYDNVRRKCLEQTPSFKYIQVLCDALLFTL